MGKTKDLGHLAHIVTYDSSNNITLPANLTVLGTITGYATTASLSSYATQSYVTTQISNLVASAPATLDTLNELATALGNDPNFATTIATSIGTKVPSTRTITINGTAYDLSADRSWNITSMIYPAAGIPLSTGTAWGTSITNNSANWDTAYGWGNHAAAGYALSSALSGYVPTSRTITINGTTLDLSANRSFTVTATETDTLATVVARGSSTTSAITINKTGTLISHSGMVDAIGYNASYGTYIGSPLGGATYYLYANGQMNNNGTIVTLLHTGNYTSTLDSRYLYATSSPNSAGNFTLSIGNNGSYSYVQSHSGQPLELNPVGNAVRIAGNVAVHAGNISSYAVTSESIGTSNTAGVVGAKYQINNDWLRVNSDDRQFQIYGNARTIIYRTDGNSNTHGGGGYAHIFYYGGSSDSQRVFIINTDGRLYSPYHGWLDSMSVNYASSSGNADTLDGYHGSNYPGKNGNSYYQVDTWLQCNGYHGLYAPSWNNAHFYPNDASYGSWRILGTRNGWAGLHFGGGNGMTLMMNETEFGFHREGYGWYARFTSGTGHFSISGTAANTSSVSSAVGGSYTWTGIQYFLTNNGTSAVNNSNTAALQAYSTGNNTAFMSFHRAGYYAVNFGLDADNWMRIGGWSAAANRWQLNTVSGDMVVNGDVTAFSDERVKENIETIDNALEKVLSLRGVFYTRNDQDDKKRKVGVIAQETLPILPEVVNTDPSGMYNVAYGNMGGLFIEAFKEQQKKIEAQDEIIEELKRIINGITK